MSSHRIWQKRRRRRRHQPQKQQQQRRSDDDDVIATCKMYVAAADQMRNENKKHAERHRSDWRFRSPYIRRWLNGDAKLARSIRRRAVIMTAGRWRIMDSYTRAKLF